MRHGCKMNRNDRTPLLYRFLLLCLLCTAGTVFSRAASQGESAGLQVIVLSGESDPRMLEGKPYALLELSNADLPNIISKSLIPSLVRRPSIRYSDFSLLGQNTFLDAYTLAKASKKRNFQWRNEISDLDLQVERLARIEGGYSINSKETVPGHFSLLLKGSYQSRRIKPMNIKGRLDRTTVAIQPVSGSRSLFVALTWTDAILHDLSETVAPNITKRPELVHRKTPLDPSIIVGTARARSLFKVDAVLDKQGHVDSERFVILDCAHPLFALTAMKAILDEWKFTPARVGHRPVETIIAIEVEFRQRR